MKPSKLNLTRFASQHSTRASRVLSVLSAAVLFTGCYTKLATSDGDHWGYTGQVKQKVVVRETEDTIVIKETRVVHQPQPVITDTLTYTNTSTGEENVVVNNYFAPAPATFGTYDPWTNNYPTWYDDYWYQPRAAIVISIGDPYHHHHRSRWFNSHWRRHSYYQSHWDYDYYNPWNNWHHASYRGPGWAYHDPYYPYPPMYSYGYGCYSPLYDPFYYGYGYGGHYGGHYEGYYGGHHGNGHHGDYGDNDYDHDNDGRDENGRERRRGNVGGEERGRGGETNDGGAPKTGVTFPRDAVSPVGLPQTDRVRAVPVSGGAIGNTANTRSATAIKGGLGGSDVQTSTGRGVGSVDISTGSIPMDANSDTRFGTTTSTREVKSSPSQGAPGVYQGPATRNSTSAGTTASQPVERRPADQATTRTSTTGTTAGRTTSSATNVVKNTDATNGTKSTTAVTPTPRSTTKSNTNAAPAKSSTKETPSYTPRSSGSSNLGVSNSGSGRSSGSGSSSSSSGSSSSRGSSSRDNDSRSSDSRTNDGGGRGRR